MPSNPMPAERLTRRRGAKAVALAVSLAALLATPGLAQASTGSTVHKISNQVGSANAALSQFTSDPSGPAAAAALARLQSYSAAAGKLTAAVYHHAHGAAGQQQAVKAVSLVARQQSNEANALSGVLRQSPGDLQSLIAQLITNSTGGREIALSVLNQLLPSLPQPAQAAVARLIAQLSTQEPAQVNQLSQGLDTGQIVCTATGFVSQALAIATTALDDALGRLGPLLGMLPSGLGGQVQSLVTGLPSMLGGLLGQIAHLLPSCQNSQGTTHGQGTQSTGIPGFGAIGQLITGIVSMVTGIVGNLIPSFGSGGGSGNVIGPGSLPGGFGNLISQILGAIPGFGSLGNLIPFFGHH